MIAPGVAPAASAGYICAGDPDGAQVGAAGELPFGAMATPETLFDLASVSKPVVACTALRLAARGALPLERPLGAWLTEAAGTPSANIPLELLLAHRAGLEAHRPLFAPVLGGRPFVRARALRTAAQARRCDCQGEPAASGFAPVYSDLGYVLVGAAIEQATGMPLDEVVHQEVAEPLRLELGSVRQLLVRRRSFATDVAPTEVVTARGGRLRGVVHDENAWALSGHGTSGHAGLFGTARAVLGFGAELLGVLAGRSTWLRPEQLWTLLRPRPGGTLRAGFDGKSEAASSAGSLAGPESFGHLGFTGTSLWCDPGAGIASVLLTNRVSPTRDNPRIRAARPLVHDALLRAAGGAPETDVLPGPPHP